MKVVILSSLSWSLINFRGALISRMVGAGHDVIACAPDAEPEVVTALEKMGVRFRLTPMGRAGTNPFDDVVTLFHYLRLLWSERPDVVVGYTQKPIIYGGLATRIMGRARFYAIMSGLGYVFSAECDGRPLLRSAVSRLYRMGVKRARCIFVFNGDDRRVMLEHGIVAPDQRVMQVPGSGIDVRHFAEQPLPAGPTTFLMVGRLMRDKGVSEFVEAARIVRETRAGKTGAGKSGANARFLLLSRIETENPTGYAASEVDAWRAAGLIEILPEVRDVRPVLGSCHVFVLPSFYREGLPRTILEALATGRAVITTDMPGCREPIDVGVNGLLVPPRDAPALAAAMGALLDNADLIASMGKAARRTAVEVYDVDKVNTLLLDVMGLGKPATAGAREPAQLMPTHA